jgi:hypothetical protein
MEEEQPKLSPGEVRPDDEELKQEELDQVAGGTGGGGTAPLPPHH